MRTTSSLWLLGMAERFKWLGLPASDLFFRANIPLSSLGNPALRVPQDNVSRLWELAEEASGFEFIGLLVGRELGVGAIPAITAGLLECTSAEAGINLILRYQKLIGETSNIKLSHERPSAQKDEVQTCLDFRFYDDQKPLSHHTVDVAMASVVRVARLVEGQVWNPSSVLLKRTVSDAKAFSDFYQCDVKFGQNRNVIFFESATHSDSKTSNDLSGEQARLPWRVENNSELTSGPTALGEMIAMVLPEQLQSGEFKRHHIARLFHLSERTLQRRLAAEGETYTGLLDRVRRSKSEELIAQGNFSQTEVAFLCGFSDLSSFHHAFQRWFGVSPGQFKRQK